MLTDKSFLTSFTVWGAALLAVGQVLEANGVIVPGTSQSLGTLLQALGSFLGIVGIRRVLAPTA